MHLSDPHSGLMVTTGIVGGGLPIADGLAPGREAAGDRPGDRGQLRGRRNQHRCHPRGGQHRRAVGAAGDLRLPEQPVRRAHRLRRLHPDQQPGRALRRLRHGGDHRRRQQRARFVRGGRRGGGPGPTRRGPDLPRVHDLPPRGPHLRGDHRVHGPEAALAAAEAERAGGPLPAMAGRSGGVPRTRSAAIDEEVADEVEAAVDQPRRAHPRPRANCRPTSSPTKRRCPNDGAARTSRSRLDDAGRRPATVHTMSGAVNQAIDVAMARRPRRCSCLGEDIEDPIGGVMKGTKGLSTKYGRERVRNTPISEQAIVGDGHRRLARGHAAGGRGHADGLLRGLHGPGGQPRGQAPLHVRRADQRADHHPHRGRAAVVSSAPSTRSRSRRG